ncbi:MAG: hypothetical protein SWO11_18870 [Thermodesulfobacteriota bacterium]|nr:hypothetical protein [Thermodesulfobacteriota bacterium]
MDNKKGRVKHVRLREKLEPCDHEKVASTPKIGSVYGVQCKKCKEIMGFYEYRSNGNVEFYPM